MSSTTNLIKCNLPTAFKVQIVKKQKRKENEE